MAPTRRRTLGNFEVMTELAEGGMGTLLLARQASLGRAAVLKKLRRELTDHPRLVKRFEREAKIAATIHHQNVVSVYDWFEHRGDRYLALEFVDGVDIAQILHRKGAIPWKVAALIAVEALRGLEEIHGAGTVHRDLKPSNILVSRRGDVKIADFGIALDATGPQLTTPGTVIGTPPYMSPEQMMGERVDGRGDLFSFGVVLYEMLAGRVPYELPNEDDGVTLLAMLQKERYEPLRKAAPGAPWFAGRCVRRCLRPKPRRRYNSVRELRQTLERRMSNPSPADCRGVIAGWLWDAQVFRPRKDETVVKISRALPRTDAFTWKWIAGVAAAVAVGALLLIRFLPEDRLDYVPTAIVGPVKSVPALDPGEMLPRLGSFAEALSGADSVAVPDEEVELAGEGEIVAP